MVPITIVDDFLEYPDQVIEFANSLEYAKDPINRWPGVRSRWLHEVDRPFFDNFCNKMFSIFFDIEDQNFRWEVNLAFQKVSNVFNRGWIHTDSGNYMTGIVYLNKECNPKSGTSIMSKKVLAPIFPQKVKEEFIKSEIETEETKEAYEGLENQFEECVAFRNKFNRFIIFPSHLHHKAQDFDNSGDRLTLIIFVKNVTATKMPLSNMRQIII